MTLLLKYKIVNHGGINKPYWSYNKWSYLETGWAPIDKLDRLFGLDQRDRGIDIFWHDVATVQQTAGHVLSHARVTLHEV